MSVNIKDWRAGLADENQNIFFFILQQIGSLLMSTSTAAQTRWGFSLNKVHGNLPAWPEVRPTLVGAGRRMLVIIASIYQTPGQCHHFRWHPMVQLLTRPLSAMLSCSVLRPLSCFCRWETKRLKVWPGVATMLESTRELPWGQRGSNFSFQFTVIKNTTPYAK